MPIYEGSRKIITINKGTGRIARGFRGSTLVYGYPSGKVIFEGTTAGTYTITLEYPCKLYIQLVGGGGYGVNNYWWHAGGGSGAYVYGNKSMNAGTYTLVVASTNSNRSNTSFAGEVAGGGERGYANLDGTRGGYGGTASTTLSYKNGNAGTFSNGGSASGGASVYGGYGRGYGNGTGDATPAYAKLTVV